MNCLLILSTKLYIYVTWHPLFVFVFVVHNDGHFFKKNTKMVLVLHQVIQSLIFTFYSSNHSLVKHLLHHHPCWCVSGITNPSNIFWWPAVYFKQLLNTISDFMDPDLLQALQFCFQSTCIVSMLRWRRVGNIPHPMWDGFPQMLINGRREMLLVSRVGCWVQSG